jgi:hypothetical protein
MQEKKEFPFKGKVVKIVQILEFLLQFFFFEFSSGWKCTFYGFLDKQKQSEWWTKENRKNDR